MNTTATSAEERREWLSHWRIALSGNTFIKPKDELPRLIADVERLEAERDTAQNVITALDVSQARLERATALLRQLRNAATTALWPEDDVSLTKAIGDADAFLAAKEPS